MTAKSKKDLVKQKHEEEVLDRAILLSKEKNKLTREILSFMDGKTICREKNDRPDIVRKLFSEQASQGEIIGIEHFLVEQVIEQQGNSRGSVIQRANKQLKNLVEKNGSTDDSQRNAGNDEFNNTLFHLAAKTNETGIQELKESFHEVFHKHLEKVQEYRNNLQKIADGKPVRLAFLIELHSHSGDVFLNNDRTIERRNNDLYPIFTWMVEELKKADPSKLNYIVLYMRHSVNRDLEDVIAVDTNDIEGSLYKQNIVVYDYCEKPGQVKFKNLGMTDGSLKYTVIVENVENYMSDLMPYLKRAYDFKKRGVPFVASRSIQELMHAYGNVEFVEVQNEMFIKCEVSKDEVLRRFEEFILKYPVDQNYDDEDWFFKNMTIV